MTISATEPLAVRAWFDDDHLWVELADGRKLAVPLAYFPRLLHATPAAREQFRLIGQGRGIHWESLDEDVSVAGLFAGVGDVTRRAAGPR